MNDGALLLRAILEHPADDTARVVYADYLQELGEDYDDERAGCIRYGVTKPGDSGVCICKYVSQRSAPCAMCLVHSCPALERVRRSNGESHYVAHRGFVVELRVCHDTFMANVEALFSRHPILDVNIIDRKAQWDSRIGLYGLIRDDGIRFQRDEARVHPEIYDRLGCGGIATSEGDNEQWTNYSDVATARLAVSRAAVRLGRERAGLRPLEDKEFSWRST